MNCHRYSLSSHHQSVPQADSRALITGPRPCEQNLHCIRRSQPIYICSSLVSSWWHSVGTLAMRPEKPKVLRELNKYERVLSRELIGFNPSLCQEAKSWALKTCLRSRIYRKIPPKGYSVIQPLLILTRKHHALPKNPLYSPRSF